MSDAATRIANQKEGLLLVPVRRGGEPWLSVATAEGKGMMGLFTFSHVRPIEDTFCALERRVCGCMQSGPHTFTVFDVKGRRTPEESSICGFFIPNDTSIRERDVS